MKRALIAAVLAMTILTGPSARIREQNAVSSVKKVQNHKRLRFDGSGSADPCDYGPLDIYLYLCVLYGVCIAPCVED